MNLLYILPLFFILMPVIILLQMQDYYLTLTVDNIYRVEKKFYDADKVLSYGIKYLKHNYNNLKSQDINDIEICFKDKLLNLKFLKTDKSSVLVKFADGYCVCDMLKDGSLLVSDYFVN